MLITGRLGQKTKQQTTIVIEKRRLTGKKNVQFISINHCKNSDDSMLISHTDVYTHYMFKLL